MKTETYTGFHRLNDFHVAISISSFDSLQIFLYVYKIVYYQLIYPSLFLSTHGDLVNAQ